MQPRSACLNSLVGVPPYILVVYHFPQLHPFLYTLQFSVLLYNRIRTAIDAQHCLALKLMSLNTAKSILGNPSMQPSKDIQPTEILPGLQPSHS